MVTVTGVQTGIPIRYPRLMDRNTALLIVFVGLAVAAFGLLALTGALNWFGRLPGDLRFGNGNVRVFAPVVSMLLLSVVLSVVLSLLRRF